MLVRPRVPRRYALLLATALVANGCFSYAVVTTLPAPGTTVDVLLSDAGTAAVTATVGPQAARILGTMGAVRGDTLEIAITEVQTRSAQSYFLQGTTISIAREHLSQVRVKTLDRRRTLIVSTVGVLGAAALISGVRFGGGGSGDGGGGGGTPPLLPP